MGLSNFREEWNEAMQVENATGTRYVRGFDKNDHPILVMRPKNENTNNHEGNIRNLVYTMEHAKACMAKTGVEKLCLVIDYDGYSIFNAPPMKTSREVLSILQDHYPELIAFVPQWFFYGFYRIISPFIDPNDERLQQSIIPRDWSGKFGNCFWRRRKTLVCESSILGRRFSRRLQCMLGEGNIDK